MKLHKLSFLLSFFIAMFLFTSCESEEFLYHEEIVPVTRYKTTSLGSVYENPNKTAKHKVNLGANCVVYVDDTVYEGKQMWVKIHIHNYEGGWMRSNQVTPFASTETVRVKHSTVEVMEAAKQPISTKIAEFYKWTHSLWDSTEHLPWINAAILLIVYLVVLIIYLRDYEVSWWLHLLMLIAGVLVVTMWLTSDMFEDGCKFDIWWLDLIFGLMTLALPLPHALAVFFLLYPTIEDIFDEPVDWIAYHAGFSIALFLPVAICFWWFKSVLDIAIISYLVVQGIFFLILLITSLINKQIMPFIWYLICFIMLGIPFMIMLCLVGALWICIAAISVICIIPFADVSPSTVIGFKIKDAFGNTIDTTDSSGHSSETGRDYNVNP